MTGVLVFFPDLNFPSKNPSVGVLEFSLNKKRQPPSALLFFLLSHVEILMGVGLLPTLVLIDIGFCLQFTLTGAGQISLVPFSDNRPPMATPCSQRGHGVVIFVIFERRVAPWSRTPVI
jgi:hypothetical protein